MLRISFRDQSTETRVISIRLVLQWLECRNFTTASTSTMKEVLAEMREVLLSNCRFKFILVLLLWSFPLHLSSRLFLKHLSKPSSTSDLAGATLVFQTWVFSPYYWYTWRSGNSVHRVSGDHTGTKNTTITDVSLTPPIYM